MLTDRYELTMYSSFVEDGSVDDHSVFEAFARRLPPGRRYGLLAGLGIVFLAIIFDRIAQAYGRRMQKSLKLEG